MLWSTHRHQAREARTEDRSVDVLRRKYRKDALVIIQGLSQRHETRMYLGNACQCDGREFTMLNSRVRVLPSTPSPGCQLTL